jgi:hypothetical protein
MRRLADIRLLYARDTLHLCPNVRPGVINHALISYKVKRQMQETQREGRYGGFAWQLNN